jgi:deoxyribodipyrimidine photo-lyase
VEKLSTNDSALKARLKKLGSTWHDKAGESVVYVMGRDQRIHDNHALIAAQKHALKYNLPLAVVFVLNVTKTERAREHYDFMISGLYELESELATYNIPFIGLVGEHVPRLEALCHHLKPAAVYMDFNPLKGPMALQAKLAETYPIITVDTHNIVPVWVVSDKQEVGARTLRPKIHHHLPDFLITPDALQKHPIPWPNQQVIPMSEVIDIFGDRLKHTQKSGIKHGYVPGEKAAHEYLNSFINSRLRGYAEQRNNPSVDGLSGLSPYLHYGQISSLRVALEASAALKRDASLQQDYDALIEEMVVRKELSDNYCFYNQNYLSLHGAPEWAQATLAKHGKDPRAFLYSKEQFKLAATHDEAWNAAQRQLITTGKIHGYMRMYWAKKVLEWSKSPENALQTLIYLNDYYSVDGNDPNGYVGILWSIAGLHDRPWGERAVYGTVRSMVYAGLKRKFDIGAYIAYYSK